jgi:predicted Zn-dependent peptidase
MFTIYCGTSPKDVEKLEEATIIELQKATRDITQKELGKVLEQYKSSILFGNESTSSRAQKGIANLFAFNRYIPADEIIQGVEKISIDEIQSFIKETTAGEITKVVYGNV